MAKTTYKNEANPIIEASPARTITLASPFVLPAQGNIKKGSILLLTSGSEVMYKSGKVYTAVTSGTTVKLYKNHSFGVGDPYFDGASESSVTAIDTSNDLYDSLTTADAVTHTLAEIVYSTSSGAVGSTDLAIVAETVIFDEDETPSVAVADKVLIDLSKMPYFWGVAIEASDIKSI